MARRLSIQELLNSEPTTSHDAAPLFRALGAPVLCATLPVTAAVYDAMHAAVQQKESSAKKTSITSNFVHSPVNTPPSSVRSDVYLNVKTTLSTLYVYDDVDAFIEFPQSGANKPIGYLMRVDPKNFRNPMHDFAYSRGEPSGQTVAGREKECILLVDSNTKMPVPCVERHDTCQGSKVCPESNLVALKQPHTSASRDAVTARIQMDTSLRSIHTSNPTAEVFRRSSALLSTIRRLGCYASEKETTSFSDAEMAQVEFTEYHNSTIRRGFKDNVVRCQGRVSLDWNEDGKALLACEHYSSTARDHFVMFLDDSYNIDYIEAVIFEDTDEVDRIELEARSLGVGPLAGCTTVLNNCAKRVVCPYDHRDGDGRLYQPAIISLPCEVRFRTYTPREDYLEACPYVLITVKGEHPHPVPLPLATPVRVRELLFDIFTQLGEDLADLTTRRFLRHPVLLAFLKTTFPDALTPLLSDLHVSLANRAHIRTYINQAKAVWYPKGTGWEGVLHMRGLHVDIYPVEARYIRRMLELDPLTMGPVSNSTANTIRVVLCMLPEGSRRLLTAQYVQSDVAFKRIAGFREFELAAFDASSHSSITFCRAFINRETAETHIRLFEEIEAVVLEDCGRPLQWYHLHAKHVGNYKGKILMWTADQHAGQAKGLGMHLQKLAQKLPPKMDLQNPDIYIQDLTAVDHLRRVFRLCEIHFMRNIRQCAVSGDVRNLMRSLACLEHPDMEGTFAKIVELGGKVAHDWLDNKTANDFVIPGVCWERSEIPLAIWKAGPRNTNVSEQSHFDVNIEGKSCTMVSGVAKGLRHDAMKLQGAKIYDDIGIRPSYSAGHPTENTIQSLKRRFNARLARLDAQDEKIDVHNTKVDAAETKLAVESRKLSILENQRAAAMSSNQWNIHSRRIQSAQATVLKARRALSKVLEAGNDLEGGTGRIPVRRPV